MATLAGVLAGRGSTPALMCCQGGPVISRSHLEAAVKSLAAKLSALGIRPGDAVSIADDNTVEFVVAFLAIVMCRGLAAPLNPAYRTEEFNFYLEDSKSKLLILPAKPCEQAEASAKQRGVPIARLAVRATPTGLDVDLRHSLPLGSPVNAKPQSADPALLLHTSGTTGRPKAVPLSHGNLQASIMNIIGTYELSPSDRSYLVMPLFHVHGLMCGLLSPLAAGAAVILPKANKFSASSFWKDAVEHQATFYTAVPTMHQVLLARAEHDYPRDSPPPLRFIRSCSSSLAPATLHALEATFKVPVLEAYAMTEASHQMTSNPLPKHGPHKAGTVGRAQGSLQVAILDSNNRVLPVGQAGEVCIRGPNVTVGYLNNPKANEEAFAGGWFHTGDQGVLDADGFLTLTGRLKEFINKGGEKISPIEVDSALLSHPSVAEAICFAAPDEKYGETVAAAIVLRPNVQDLEEALKENIKAHVRDKLAAFKTPSHIFFSKVLPKTATGKIQRRKMVDHFMGGKPAESAAPPKSDQQGDTSHTAGELTGHQVIARALKEAGVTHAFGVIGIPVTPMASALQEVGIRFLSFRNEQAAGYAAAAAGYLQRRPAAFLTVSGPGFINGLAGLSHAAVNGFPLIMMSGSAEQDLLGAGAFQECDQLALAGPHCKAVSRVTSLRTAAAAAAALAAESMAGRPGPTYLDLPSDVLNTTIATPMLPPSPPRAPPPPRRVASSTSIRDAIAALNGAKRPLVVVGHGAILAGADAIVSQLTLSAGIPLLGTPMAKGVLPDEHPLSATAARTLVLQHCDVALLVGAPLNWQLHHGLPPKWSEAVKFVVVDHEVAPYDATKALVKVEGDITAAIRDVARGVKPAPEWKAWSDEVAGNARRATAKLEGKLKHNAFPLDFQTSLRVIRDGIHASPQRNSIVVTSEGANTMDVARMVVTAYAAPTRIDAGVWGTMGVGLPGAIAAAAIQAPRGPRAPVVALEGDSALGFTMAELETVCRYKLPIVVLVFNNTGIYGGDRRTAEQQDIAKAGLRKARLELDPAPTALTPGARHDLVMKAFGGKAWAVKDAKELEAAFADALASGQPCLIDITIDPMAGRESGSVHDFNKPASKL